MATDSSQTTAEQPAAETQADQDIDALREGMVLREGIKRLMALAGVDSNTRNLEAEDAAVNRDLQIGQQLYGKDAIQSELGSEMRATAARDVIVTINKPSDAQAQQAATSTPAVPPTTEPSAQPATQPALSTLAKAAVVGSALLGGSGLTAAVMNYVNQPAQQIVQPANSKDYTVGGSVEPIE